VRGVTSVRSIGWLDWHSMSMWTILDHMQRTSLVQAKAHLSELVDAAEHRGQRILILRHGKPAAAIVPVRVAEEGTKRRAMTQAQAEAFMDEIAASAPNAKMSIAEALGRDRLDGIE
jgi:prevent-host-death family protein